MIVRSVTFALDIVRLHAVIGRVDDRAVPHADHRMGNLPLAGEADGLADLGARRSEDDVTGHELFDLDAASFFVGHWHRQLRLLESSVPAIHAGGGSSASI